MKAAPLNCSQNNNSSTTNLVQISKIKQKTRCHYRIIEDHNKVQTTVTQQFYHYLQNVYDIKQQVKNEDEDEIISEKSSNSGDKQESFDEYDKSQNFESSNKHKEEVKSFLEKSKLNVYKNILYAFNKHIESCEEEHLIKLYESYTIDNWTFDHIKMRVCQNLKNTGRSSLKIRNLFRSKNLQKIFVYFLKNAYELWLSNSKIQDKENYKSSIDMLLKGHEYKIVDKSIQYYKKSKK